MKAKRLAVPIAVMALALVISVITALIYMRMWKPDVIVKGPGVTQVKMVSDYFPELKGTAGDTDIYFLEGEEPGGTICVMGGTHPHEPAGWMAAILIVENAIVTKGRLIVIPQCNNSAFTHNFPQEGWPQRAYFDTPHGTRSFRFGSRYTNAIHAWPDPEIYVHRPSGQNLSSFEVRNLNRSYPGHPNASFTQRVAYGFKQLLVKEEVDFNIDLHEAPPEYPFINAIGAHERAREIAALAAMELQAEGIIIGLEFSPPRFHGLTYRELGDFTSVTAVLLEGSNPIQGRLRGITDETLIHEGKDAFYVQAAKLGRTYVPFDEEGWPLDVRTGRHLSTVLMLAKVFSEMNPEKTVLIENIPGLEEVKEKGIGHFLRPVK